QGHATTIDGRADARDVDPAVRLALADPRLRQMLSPFGGMSRLHFESRVLTVSDADITSEWTSATGSGRFDLDGPVDCRLHLVGARLAPVTRTPGPEFAWLDSGSEYRLDGVV